MTQQQSTSYGNLVLPFVAGEDLSTYQYKWVALSADDTIEACDNAADDPIGILQDKPTSGQVGSVMVFGMSRLKSDSGGLTQGDQVGTDANARGTAKTLDKAIAPARCILGASGEDEIATVLVNCVGGRNQLNV